MFTQIVLVALVLIGALLLYAATRPNSLHVERSATIAASAEAIAPLINDFHRWNAWSPYDKRDPAMKRVFAGAATGKGAVYEWNGNNHVGQGRMEIAESVSPSKLTIKLDFIKPFEAHNTVDFTLESKGETTSVNWAIHGPSPYISKLIGIFISMDSMIGKDFEAGLAALKNVAEK